MSRRDERQLKLGTGLALFGGLLACTPWLVVALVGLGFALVGGGFIVAVGERTR